MKEIPSPFEIFANRRTIQWLFVPVILLPVGIVFLLTFGRFFALFHDPISAAILDWTALGLGFFWFLSLVSMLLIVSWQFSIGNGSDSIYSETDFDSSDNTEDGIAKRR